MEHKKTEQIINKIMDLFYKKTNLETYEFENIKNEMELIFENEINVCTFNDDLINSLTIPLSNIKENLDSLFTALFNENIYAKLSYHETFTTLDSYKNNYEKETETFFVIELNNNEQNCFILAIPNEFVYKYIEQKTNRKVQYDTISRSFRPLDGKELIFAQELFNKLFEPILSLYLKQLSIESFLLREIKTHQGDIHLNGVYGETVELCTNISISNAVESFEIIIPFSTAKTFLTNN